MLQHIQNANIRPSFSTASVFGNYSPDAIAMTLLLDCAPTMFSVHPGYRQQGGTWFASSRHGLDSERFIPHAVDNHVLL
jgi:hypothetical protein